MRICQHCADEFDGEDNNNFCDRCKDEYEKANEVLQ